MSDTKDPKELLGQVESEDLRNQLQEVFDALSGSALRQQVEDLKAENKTFKQQARTRAFKDAGFDPESGAGKAVAKLYDGEPDPEAIQQFAKEEFGFEPDGTSGSQPTNGDEPSGDDRLASLNSGHIPPREPSIDDQIKQAESSGDWDTYDQLQAAKLESLRAS